MATAETELEARAALDDWLDAGLVEVALPSGGAVKVEPSGFMDLLVSGVLPQPITEAVLAQRPEKANALAETSQGLDLIRETYRLAAAAVKRIRRGDAWLPIVIDVATFSRLPVADRMAISKVAIGEELGEVVAGLATFRDEPGRPDAGPDGADVGPAPVDAPRPNRAARRARS